MRFLFTFTIFSSALLLFLIQPVVTKILLPRLGGAPAVWNTAVVFFQAMLLGGYLYAHATAKFLKPRKQATLHMVLVLLSLFLLPVGFAATLNETSTITHPYLWLLITLMLGVGVPFFILSANAPMVQHWFVHTKNSSVDDPYFLYAASNLGSFLALLSYPFLIEPLIPLSQQTEAWSAAYGAFALLLGSCAVAMHRNYKEIKGDERIGPSMWDRVALLFSPSPLKGEGALGHDQRIFWLLFSFAPAGLLIAVTTHITIDISPAPLLWVIPLALYLLTFVLAFAERQAFSMKALLMLHFITVMLLATVVSLTLPAQYTYIPWLKDAWANNALHLIAFFFAAMLCHFLLAQSKPSVRHLTEFYVWVSLGGVLGSAFAAFLAPMMFEGIYEYPLLLILVCLLRPVQNKMKGWKPYAYDAGVALLLLAALIGIKFSYLEGYFKGWGLAARSGLLVVLGFYGIAITLFALTSYRRPVRLGLGVGGLLLATIVSLRDNSMILHAERNFFGVSKVEFSKELRSLMFIHGHTLHGSQRLTKEERLVPLTYFHPMGPLGDVFDMLPQAKEKEIAIAGLGIGAITCYGKKGQRFTYFEIDPAVIRIARNEEFFTFLRDCLAQVEVIEGDARLKIAETENERFGMIILDIFSSGAIPMHVLTREAVALYMKKLKPDGVLVLHITNEFVDLAPLVAGLARDAGLSTAFKVDAKRDIKSFKMPSKWAVMAHEPEDIAPLLKREGWQVFSNSGKQIVWTDDFSHILGALRFLNP